MNFLKKLFGSKNSQQKSKSSQVEKISRHLDGNFQKSETNQPSLDVPSKDDLLGAIQFGNEEKFEEMLKQAGKINSNLLSGSGASLFTIACYRFSNKIVEQLINMEADVNFRGKDGSFPLLAASTARKLETVKTLLKKGVDADINQNNEGQTALMDAIFCVNMVGHGDEYFEISKLLLQHTQDTMIKNNNGKQIKDLIQEIADPTIKTEMNNLLNQKESK